MELKDRLKESTAVVCGTIGDFVPQVGIILGSGWGPVADRVENPVYVPFGEVPYMKVSTANSHVGRFVFGMLGGKPVAVMQGRLHGYEGCTAQEVAYPVWLMHELGVKTIITCNAAGAMDPDYHVGDHFLMTDQINFTGRNPLDSVEADHLATRFVPMLNCFSPALQQVAREAAAHVGATLREGVYLGLFGPSFETPAEIRAYRMLGGDAVAMSVCEEVIAARHVGMNVIGMSLLTNMACGIQGSDPNDDEVIEVSKTRETVSAALITRIVELL